MPPGTDQYDYRTDPEFVKASSIDQKAYLMKADPDFASAHPDEQAAYLTHIKGLNNPTQFEKDRASDTARFNTSPTESQLTAMPGNVGKQSHLERAAGMAGSGRYAGAAHEVATGAAEGLAPIGIGAALTSPVGTAGALGGGLLGQKGLSSAARSAGASEDQANLAGDVGGLVGGTLGGSAGGLAEGIGRKAASTPGLVRGIGRDLASKVSPRLADAILPEPMDAINQAVSEGRANKVPTTMPKVPKPADPVAEAIKGGIANKVPTTMPKVPDPLSEAVKRGDANRLPGRIDQVGELNRQGLANKIPTRMNRSVGEGGAGGSVGTKLPDVSVIPEPREPVPGVPNNMGSTPRADLQDLAQSATPHAGQQLQSLGSKVIYEPRGGTGYGGPRQESIGTPLPSQEPAPVGLKQRPPNEVYMRPHMSKYMQAQSPTGTVALPPEVHAELERQAGRPLTPQEANYMDRQSMENGMVEHAGDVDEASAIREKKRAQLEQPDPDRYKKKGK